MRLLRDLWHALEELILPATPLCGLCAEYPSLPVGACKACLDSLAIRWEKREVQGYSCFSLFPYQGFGRDLIHRLKFQSALEIACTLGSFLGLAAREEPELAKVDVLLPVPLHQGRLEQRGFNQAAILCDYMRKLWKRPVCDHVVRARQTRTQSGLSATKRQKNLQRAFAVLPGFDFQDKYCLIVDDVITSGHTFVSVAQLLEEYGGRPMGIFAARTEKWKDAEQPNKAKGHLTFPSPSV